MPEVGWMLRSVTSRPLEALQRAFKNGVDEVGKHNSVHKEESNDMTDVFDSGTFRYSVSEVSNEDAEVEVRTPLDYGLRGCPGST